MSDKVWAVKQQSYSSYDGLSSGFDIVSLHRTEAGANKVAEKMRRDGAIYAVTGGNLDEESDADTVLGEVEGMDSNWGSALKAELAKPDAILMESVLAVIEKFHIDMAEIRVSPWNLHE